MTSDSEDSLVDSPSEDVNQDEKEQSKAGKPKPRKRTKTGCLTCRKRRIKCGEERPVCKNCIKSKRECAGYNPPSSINKVQDAAQAVPPLGGYPFSQQQRHAIHDPVSQGFAPTFGSHYHHMNSHFDLANGLSAPSEISSTSDHSMPMFLSGFEPPSATLSQGPWSSSQSSQGVALDSMMLPQYAAAANRAGRVLRPNELQLPMGREVFPRTQYQEGFVPHLSYPYDQNDLESTPSFPAHVSATSFSAMPQASDFEPWQQSHQQNTQPQHHFFMSKQDELASGFAAAENNDLRDNIAHLRTMYPNSPLLDEHSRDIFRHFLDVVGPCMSIFDRLERADVPATQTMVWTNGLPRMALQHPALAHAILAISALHISSVNQTSDEFAIQHFTSALQEVKPLLETKKSRADVATLATILLLAYYEVLTGDHARWSLHISGAARLVLENDYAGTLRTISWMRKRARMRIAQVSLQQPQISDKQLISVAQIPETLLDDRDWDLDQDLISLFMGIHVNYDTQMQPHVQVGNTIPDLNAKEADEFRILMEMYWWYCKQDLFQSLLSGDAPMLAYAKWKYCPPRGQIGIAEKPYATVDHLWLLLARIVDFGFRDRSRKLRGIAANNGIWIPPAGFLPDSPRSEGADKPVSDGPQSQDVADSDSQGALRPKNAPVANESRTRSSKPRVAPKQQPFAQPIYGMVPLPQGPVHMSPSFQAVDAELQKRANPSSTATTSPSDDSDLNADLQRALSEHNLISEALLRFRSVLSDGFHPLVLQSTGAASSSPFGPPLIYSSPTIAVMWTYYHVAKLVLRRMHPHSPPAAMMSAGVNAAVTAEDAQIIGRICAGLYAQHDALVLTGQVDHLITAALIESSFSLLFAAVQYHHPAQRHWTITKLKALNRSTGWASSMSTAVACEVTWSKMGEIGKGPPYERTLITSHGGDARRGPADALDEPVVQTSNHVRNSLQEHESRFVRHDRSLIGQHASTRAYWALGLLSVEDDLKVMNINDDERK